MKELFIRFVTDTTKENFEAIQQAVFDSAKYNAYSSDFETLTRLLNEEKYQELADLQSVNLLLSPRAHQYKYFAYKELGNEDGSRAEMLIALKLLEGICLTGTGTAESPYRPTNITDEQDVLTHLEEQFASQQLKSIGDKRFDVISTVSGCSIWFDITIPYTRMQMHVNSGQFSGFMEEEGEMPERNRPSKKWWQFWK